MVSVTYSFLILYLQLFKNVKNTLSPGGTDRGWIWPAGCSLPICDTEGYLCGLHFYS